MDTFPRQGLIRAFASVDDEAPVRAAEVDGDDETPVLRGHFAVFDRWAHIDSVYEGHFMERFAPGAFADTIAKDRASMKVLFQHGRDPQIGNKPIATIDELEEDKIGVRYAAPLLSARYVTEDLLPGLKAPGGSVYGASFRFDVSEEEVNQKPGRSKTNPDGLPERTVTKARVYEFGPVTWPAYPSASAGVRSLTDLWTPAAPAPPTPSRASASTQAPRFPSLEEWLAKMRNER